MKKHPSVKWIFKLNIFLLFLLSIQTCFSQTEEIYIEWEKSYGGSEKESLKTMVSVENGDYLLGGWTTSYSYGRGSFYVVRINQKGERLWNKIYRKENTDSFLNDILPTVNEDFILLGYTDYKDGSTNVRDILNYKIDKDGTIIWEKSYGGTEWDYLRTIQSTIDGGFLSVGYTNSIDGDVISRENFSFNFWDFDGWLVKFDEDGNIIWEKSYGENYSNDILLDIYPINDGYLIGGSTSMDKFRNTPSGINGPKSFYLIKIDLDGNVIWEKIYGGSEEETIEKIISTDDGGYLILGGTLSNDGDVQSRKDKYYDPEQYDMDVWIVKIDKDGNIIWEKSYGGDRWDRMSSVIKTENHNYTIGGYSDSKINNNENREPGDFDFWVFNIDDSGNINWEQRFGGSGSESIWSIIQTNDKGYLLGGISESQDGDISQDFGGLDYWVVKTVLNDNDGVNNDIDLCPNTPKGEGVDSNGCSDSQIDTDGDGDGVTDDTDQCNDTPSGETVDSNGCSSSQKDTDGDFVTDDIDLCPNTLKGETVDSNGCSDSQKDTDGDGVKDDLDTCPNTPSGETVDTYGCIILPYNNFTIKVTSETCPNKNNGQISISTIKTYDYVLTINGIVYNFTNNLNLDNLSPDIYEVCIGVSGMNDPQCYSVEVKEGNTVSGKSSVSSNKVSIEIIEGTSPYIIFQNGKELFKTNSKSFSLDVKHGDLIEVKTDVICEGTFSKSIELFDYITVYPNPTKGNFEVSLPVSQKEVTIELYTIHSQLISVKSYPIMYGRVQMNLEGKSSGTYLVKVLLDKPITLKIIKE